MKWTPAPRPQTCAAACWPGRKTKPRPNHGDITRGLRRSLAIGRAIKEILLVTDLTLEGELAGQALYLPL